MNIQIYGLPIPTKLTKIGTKSLIIHSIWLLSPSVLQSVWPSSEIFVMVFQETINQIFLKFGVNLHVSILNCVLLLDSLLNKFLCSEYEITTIAHQLSVYRILTAEVTCFFLKHDDELTFSFCRPPFIVIEWNTSTVQVNW